MSLKQSEKNRQIVPASSDPALISPTHRVERAAGEFRRGVPVLIRPPTGALSLTAAAETVGDQTMRFNYFHDRSTAKNIGVGGFDLLERGYSNEDSNHNGRVDTGEIDPVPGNAAGNSRVIVRRSVQACNVQ